MDFTSISEKIWDIKYRFKDKNKIYDQTIEDTWKRVAKSIAVIEKKENRANFQKEFYEILENFQFLPGGRILAGAGTHRKVTLFNCFVIPILDDSLKGIFDALKDSAFTLQAGGGVGLNFSPLRAKGFLAKHTGSDAAGPISFMRMWNAMSSTMESSGARRGAMMGILNVDHPDIEEFITAKTETNELTHFNISVFVSDEFMQAVKNDTDWVLQFPNNQNYPKKIVSAKKLWEKIIRSAYDSAEPGVLFQDTINQYNNLYYRENISATNPCGEIPLGAYGACNLGSINLTQFVLNPFSENASVDWLKMEKVVAIATRFLDNVIDVSKYPLSLQQKEALATRRIGLGITGLADFFIMLNIRYGSQQSIQLAKDLMRKISETTWQISSELAKERGSFPAFEKEKYLSGKFVATLSDEIKRNIETLGMRNSHHNTIAPAGTISLLANNVSNGIEPVFSPEYERIVRLPNDISAKFKVKDYALQLWHLKNEKDLPPAWVDAQTLTPSEHLAMQAALQIYVDNSISKTINIPQNYPFELLEKVYSEAHALGLKGCTIFRPNSITGSILSLEECIPCAIS